MQCTGPGALPAGCPFRAETAAQRTAHPRSDRSRADYGVFVLDSQTSECLYYEAAVGYPPTKHVRIPRELLAEHPEVEIRNDLIDCSIDVCSVEVRLSAGAACSTRRGIAHARRQRNRSRPSSRTISTTATSGATLCTACSRRTCS